MLFRKKKNANPYGKYPCEVYLNNAIRCIFEGKEKAGLGEICYFLSKARGKVYEDVLKMIEDNEIMSSE